VLVGAHAEDVPVEGTGGLRILGRDAEEVESFDDGHAGEDPTCSAMRDDLPFGDERERHRLGS
jgi:hypothetical protein